MARLARNRFLMAGVAALAAFLAVPGAHAIDSSQIQQAAIGEFNETVYEAATVVHETSNLCVPAEVSQPTSPLSCGQETTCHLGSEGCGDAVGTIERLVERPGPPIA